MADRDAPPHKRTKSQIAKSLLGRHSNSRIEVQEDDNDAASRTSGIGSEVSSIASHSNTHLPSLAGKRLSKHRPNLSMTMSQGDITSKGKGSSNPESPVKQLDDGGVPASPAGTSLEQSVKLFRLFEALRSGDTTAISKAMRKDAEPADSTNKIEGTTILHMAIQCAELPVTEFVLSNIASSGDAEADVNARDRDGNTPLHIAARLNRTQVVKLLLQQPGINDAITNHNGQTPLDLANSPDMSQQLTLARSLYLDANIQKIHSLVVKKDYSALEELLTEQRLRTTLDIDSEELPTDPQTTEAGGTLLHEAARRKDHKLIQLLLLNGADPFRRDRKGKLPQDVTKDDRTRAILKKSPAAAAAQRGIQERTILGGQTTQSGISPADHAAGNKEAREMKGYLKKWTNYTGGWKLRWFVLEDGVLSYYKHQDDAGTACRGAINMKIAKLNMDPQDKLRFEIQGKSSVKYHLRANHQIECKRWYWALNNAIQWTKDEAREEEKRKKVESDTLSRAKEHQHHLTRQHTRDDVSIHSSKSRPFHPSTAVGVPLTSGGTSASGAVGQDDETATYEPSIGGQEFGKMVSQVGTTTIEGDLDDEEEYGDDASSHEIQPVSRDAFAITAQSVRLQLDLLAQVSSGLHAEQDSGSTRSLQDPVMIQALSAYDSAVGNLRGLVGDLLRISKDRDAYWQYRLDREANIRKMWEESMAKVAREQEELQVQIGESENKRKKTKRALKDALETLENSQSKPVTPGPDPMANAKNVFIDAPAERSLREMEVTSPPRRKSTFVEFADISDSDSDEDEEFFDAVGSGEVEVVEMSAVSPSVEPVDLPRKLDEMMKDRAADIALSYRGYEGGIRKRLKMDADNRPKVSLWGILKSMIGKDMTKMTLPVSFNEPTSLLYRVVEDMEYTELLDLAATRLDSTERLLYVAAFAASEYASTIGRVAKPFNPLLGETFEYVRPDKGYRFFIEQVSHHPPIGAAYAESASWDYWGESAVKSKFYGKSFDINPLGTWFLNLRPASGGEELYTWKKVTSSVIGIITGNPSVDNYGVMEVKNWTTGEVCTLEFKARGWKASSAFHVVGRVSDADGKTRWSVGGRWNDTIYARLTPGWEDSSLTPSNPGYANLSKQSSRRDTNQAFQIWQASERPTGIPFNLTPFVVTLNDLPDALRPHVAPTDSRLRPDQRAMEDGEYDKAADEKNRLEEKQRAKRRWREQKGEEFSPRWFKQVTHKVTGDKYWLFNHEYWKIRKEVSAGKVKWEDQGLEEIF